MTIVHSHGYLEVYLPTHPLAAANGRVYEHRLVLFGRIGAGEHPCHWCGRSVSWDDKSLEVDHLDHDRANNAAANLVPSCHRCNSQRSRMRTGRRPLTADDVVLIRASAEPHVELARRFDVSDTLVRKIRTGERWRAQEEPR